MSFQIICLDPHIGMYRVDLPRQAIAAAESAAVQMLSQSVTLLEDLPARVWRPQKAANVLTLAIRADSANFWGRITAAQD